LGVELASVRQQRLLYVEFLFSEEIYKMWVRLENNFGLPLEKQMMKGTTTMMTQTKILRAFARE